MTSKLIHKNNYYYCSECHARQMDDINLYCDICGANFSNYEEILLLKFHEDMDKSMRGLYDGKNE